MGRYDKYKKKTKTVSLTKRVQRIAVWIMVGATLIAIVVQLVIYLG